MAVARYNTRELTKHLRNLAIEAHSVTDSGDVITRSHKMAEILWKKALGYTEATTNKKGEIEDKYNPPESWAITMIYERLEGRVANAAVEDGGKTSVADRVSDLARERINKMSAEATKFAPRKAGPPKLPRKES